ncbi:hypothetical protein ACMYR3_11335 [Ampullimonas aquatilis]|uniref:hypothetical protein n=1 Tax=Ampullimonas aquatilis TaxID=1341549 RepID=UPI003C74DD50
MIELIILPILALAIWLIVRKTGLPDPASLSDEGLAARLALEQAWLQKHASDCSDAKVTVNMRSTVQPTMKAAAAYEQRHAYWMQLNAELAARKQIEQ